MKTLDFNIPSIKTIISFVCVECGYNLKHLYRDYGKGNIRLAICPNCNCIADPYVEYENILLFLEIMLFKPQVYRHVLYNMSTPLDSRFLWKIFLMIVMLDMNVKAYLIDRNQGVLLKAESYTHANSFFSIPTLDSGFYLSQYSLYLILLSMVENIVYLVMVYAMLQYMYLSTCNLSRLQYIGTMLISSFAKMFILLSVIWEYHWIVFHVIGVMVIVSNCIALELYLSHATKTQTKIRKMTVLAAIIIGLLCRFLSQLGLYYLGNPIVFSIIV